MMEILLLVAIILGFGAGFALIWFKIKSLESSSGKTDDQSLTLINQNIQSMQDRLDNNTQAINQRLDMAASVIGNVTRELGAMSQIGNQIAQFQELLKSPKLRGGLGEQGLKDLLLQCLPAELLLFQHRFSSGNIVDAAIKINSGLIPIDSKFPLENFNRYLNTQDETEKTGFANAFRRDFRARVGEISKKYILPSEGTSDFAVMYLPSETVYYELISNEKFRDLYDYAANEKVVVTSPSTFFYYLRTIMLGLEGQRINKMAREILVAIRSIQVEAGKFGGDIRVLSKHLANAKNTMDNVQNDFTRLAQKIDTATQIEGRPGEAENPQITTDTTGSNIEYRV